MILTTTPSVEGRSVSRYLGIATGEVIVGANVFRDMFASVTDILGGRASSYEGSIRKARLKALDELAAEASELGADAVLGVSITYGAVGQGDSMFMVTATGTAVKLA